MKIGVFDSGVGGLSVANAIEAVFPGHQIVFQDDREHLPYGNRRPDEIFSFIVPIFQSMIDSGCRVIVVACNTVTTTLIDRIREHFDIPFVAIEPMIKPAAALTKTGVIAVCATPATLASPRYQQLKADYAKHVKVLEPNCSDWALMIEAQQIDRHRIIQRIEAVLAESADVIVLGCTHYHWIEAEIKNLADGRAVVIQPELAIIKQLRRVLAQLA